MKKLANFIIILPLATQAETFHAPQPVFFENNVLPKQAEPQIKTQSKAESVPTSSFALSNADSTKTKLEKLINYGVVKQQWHLLKQILPLYQQQANYDETLYRYAMGAMLWAEKEYAQAISLYQQILDEKPELAYPRFDLGVMLFENKQYRQAKAELEHAKPELSPQMQQLTERYMQAMAERQSWQPDMELQYTQTDNVNNASSQQDIILRGLRFKKDEESLPQKAHGFRYGVGVNRELNISGNHFVTANGRFSGVHYWDNQDYSEKSLYASLGYRYRSALQAVGFSPFFEQNWLGSPRYSKNYGAVADFRRELTAYWAISGSFSHTQKRYADASVARRHNGYLNGVSLTLSYQAKPNWLLFSGVEGSVDRSKDKAESSLRRGVNIGSVWKLKEFVSHISLRYVKRDFRAENFYFPTKKRQDKEYSLNVSIGNNRLQWLGFVPKLNYRYRKIDSNIPEFYSRKSGEWFISVEKDF
ncbi:MULTISPECIES: surface lipoprotein assembly modifier [Haemophilus]|jgi:hypothetical protein|uniref:surface lipoprotein assembly modifier n=1 Tax=Haemophilus TaxID=724 RepID=UPI0006655A7D|nr:MULTISPECIES: porin family protein [Haemophilus]UJZ90426.1 surface lipoprotein assembly modifier [Haemophilus seminalis]